MYKSDASGEFSNLNMAESKGGKKTGLLLLLLLGFGGAVAFALGGGKGSTPLPPTICNDPNADNNGQVGACTYSHKECIGGKCMLIPGGGNDLCTLDAQCVTHLECQGGKCVDVLGSGLNKCVKGVACSCSLPPDGWNVSHLNPPQFLFHVAIFPTNPQGYYTYVWYSIPAVAGYTMSVQTYINDVAVGNKTYQNGSSAGVGAEPLVPSSLFNNNIPNGQKITVIVKETTFGLAKEVFRLNVCSDFLNAGGKEWA